MTSDAPIRVAAVADIHCNKTSQSALNALFSHISTTADVFLLCGDLTDIGQIEEAQILAKELTTIKIPVIGVLGNHDFESGKQNEIKTILEQAGMTVLDGDTCVVRGIGFAGIKGFPGGFGKFALQSWGERAIKQFVQETVDEALRLESALSRLEAEQRIVVMHYSPIRSTVEGEPVEIFPFLGSSRLEEPINRFEVEAVFHGHAHGGSPEGWTAKNVPVYNVSMSVLRKAFPDRPPFRLFELAPGRQPTERPALQERRSVPSSQEMLGGAT